MDVSVPGMADGRDPDARLRPDVGDEGEQFSEPGSRDTHVLDNGGTLFRDRPPRQAPSLEKEFSFCRIACCHGEFGAGRLATGHHEVDLLVGGSSVGLTDDQESSLSVEIYSLVVFNGVDRGAVHDFEHAGHDAAGEDRIQGCCA